MFRGGRGDGSSRGGRGGRGGFRGRGTFGGSTLPPMGLTFGDIQNLSMEESPLFPPMEPLPVMSAITDEEREIAKLQLGFVTRLRNSPYYVMENTKSTELPRYSDKYRPQASAQPTLKKKDLNPAFFPPDLFESYFNPKKKRKATSQSKKPKLDLDQLQEEPEDNEEKGSADGSQAGSEAEEDYDVEEEDDNDYAENYFDNGEGDDLDDIVGGDDVGGGGGGDYD